MFRKGASHVQQKPARANSDGCSGAEEHKIESGRAYRNIVVPPGRFPSQGSICCMFFCIFFVSMILFMQHVVGVMLSCEWETGRSMWRNCWVGTVNTAGIYYQWRKAVMLADVDNYMLHWAFAQTRASTDLTYDEMVKARFEAMLTNQEQWKRDDIKLERDKCLMYDFFVRHGFRIAPIHWRTTSLREAAADIKSGSLFANVTSWPVFMKACHLSMGTADGVLMVRSVSKGSNGWVYKAKTPKYKKHVSSEEELIAWVDEKFNHKSADPGRKWTAAADKLSSSTEPGFILQGPAELSYVYQLGEHQVFEVKTYVQWGHAFAAMPVDVNGVLFLRGSFGSDADVVPLAGFRSLLYLHKLFHTRELPTYWNWVLANGHFKCVWNLAEKAAKDMHIDEVRIDIFFSRKDPNGCTVNEISLSSGYGQAQYRTFMAKLWELPHVDKRYRTVGSATSAPVYKLAPGDLADLR